MRRRFLFSTLTFILCTMVVLLVGEAMVRWLAPVKSLHPRYRFSKEYGIALFPSTTMVHTVPGRFWFEYTVNQDGFRGPVPGNDLRARRILCLGDSYTFGMGVPDGSEFASVLGARLGEDYEVLNRGVPGWGLTQQIRLYHEMGRTSHPAFVLLQFCANDPTDNLYNLVTQIEDGRFVFQDSKNAANSLKLYLSKSWIQRSQLYNFFRQRAYLLWQRRHVGRMEDALAAGDPGTEAAAPSPAESFHADLLSSFVQLLAEDQVSVILFSVEGHLQRYPLLVDTILRLEQQGLLVYLDTAELFGDAATRKSPEGHWGIEAHARLAEELAELILFQEQP